MNSTTEIVARKQTKDRPRIGVAVLIVDGDGRLLLGRRAKEPNYGKWVIPGGGIEHGESWLEAARREIDEETGLCVSIAASQRPFIQEILTPTEHRLILFVTGSVIGGHLRAATDLLEAQFFSANELRHLADISPVIEPVLAEFGWGSRAGEKQRFSEAR